MNTQIKSQLIRAQLEKILSSEAFVRSRRMQRFLEFITEETLAGRADQLGEYAIGVAVFDRGVDFEPGLDPIVRNDARRLRVKLLEYYRQEGSAERLVISMPKGAYVPVFESTPVCAMPVSPATRRLGVLPIEPLSSGEGEFLARALSMSLTARLTNLDGLETVAHGYLREQTMRQSASQLQLTYAVCGSFLVSRERCHVVVNLVSAAEGTQLWAREYDFPAQDLIDVQAEIAAHLRKELSLRMGGRQPVQFALAA